MYLKKQIQNGLLSISKMNKKEKKDGNDKEILIDTSLYQDDEIASSIRSLSALSLHKSSGHSSVSSHTQTCSDSFSTALGDSLNGSMPVQFSKTNKSSAGRTKAVTFDDANIEIRRVESYMKYSSDLWWSREEVRQRQVENNFILFEYCNDELERIYRYSNAYYNARQKSSISKEAPDKDKNSKTKINISNEDYRLIVQGKAAGYDGLEKLCAERNMLPSSSSEISSYARKSKSIVRKIVASHQNMFFDSSTTSRRKNGRDNDIDRQLRSYARSLTSLDRSWAVIMGNSDRDALLLS